eukprot:CAMPEP_0173404002 /NCGR_PEP_ID=MMETSP1356-20130122/58199_1 /TAXON_ID=77927 ORGANISM="Hemiselmis virescens, Strain PCC157" /NCGR_SAMPLE_ID=MMETSP1356 /ASSEMBLY_ACC=CAM_ASM_000847 /LENGTH=135 /DNA_ID=CAMNT_0014364607 /DNA_START=70 /DNA_END=477 /DNA_ORIENTATION=+
MSVSSLYFQEELDRAGIWHTRALPLEPARRAASLSSSKVPCSSCSYDTFPAARDGPAALQATGGRARRSDKADATAKRRPGEKGAAADAPAQPLPAKRHVLNSDPKTCLVRPVIRAPSQGLPAMDMLSLEELSMG